MGRIKCHKILLEKKVKTLTNGVETNLYKWDKVENDFDSGKEMDPVKLKRFKKTEYFTVLDGRHQVWCISRIYSCPPESLRRILNLNIFIQKS